ncbi:MAG: hypothetical protein MI976_25295 [Pseudomonadales bacterium]|nr:hypothetical protein [Pseudomonadales bacterium]
MSIQNLGPLLQLGESTGTMTLDGKDDFRAALDNMAQQARHSIKIFTQELDHELYDDVDFLKVASDVGRNRKHCEIQILVKDANKATKLGHRLVELHRRLPTSILIHQLPRDYIEDNDEYMLVDDIGLVKRYTIGYMQGCCEFKSIPEAQKKARYFDSIWQRSEPCQDLRRISL